MMKTDKQESLARLIQVAKGNLQADLLFINARVVNVFTGRVFPSSVAVAEGHVAGFGKRDAKETIDLQGKHLVPGLIDAHIHIESTMAAPPAFARCAIAHGTTAVVADPHEIANVMGAPGIEYMLETSENQPMGIFYMLPSCVPATNMETSGADLAAADLEPFFDHPRVLGLAEMMNFPGVLFSALPVMEKILAANRHEKLIDGHAPLLSGKDLDAYLCAGIGSDHESSRAEEAREKLEKGMHLMIREGTAAKNMADLLPIVNKRNMRRVMFCSDDRHPYDLIDQGHMDSIVRRAVQLGADPVAAITMASLSPAEYFGLRDRGAIAPGRRANMVVVDDLKQFEVEKVYYGGVLVARDGKPLTEPHGMDHPDPPPSMNVKSGNLDFSIPAVGNSVRVIRMVPGQVLTEAETVEPARYDGLASADPFRDIAKLAVIERHRATGNVGLGFVRGFGLQSGAVAGSIAHDSHNLIVAGVSDRDMDAAAKCVMEMGGGLAAASDGKILSSLALPVAGLMANRPMEEIAGGLARLLDACRSLGVFHADPFMALSFLALPVIPHLKLTDLGLVDVDRFEIVPLFV